MFKSKAFGVLFSFVLIIMSTVASARQLTHTTEEPKELDGYGERDYGHRFDHGGGYGHGSYGGYGHRGFFGNDPPKEEGTANLEAQSNEPDDGQAFGENQVSINRKDGYGYPTKEEEKVNNVEPQAYQHGGNNLDGYGYGGYGGYGHGGYAQNGYGNEFDYAHRAYGGYGGYGVYPPKHEIKN